MGLDPFLSTSIERLDLVRNYLELNQKILNRTDCFFKKTDMKIKIEILKMVQMHLQVDPKSRGSIEDARKVVSQILGVPYNPLIKCDLFIDLKKIS